MPGKSGQPTIDELVVYCAWKILSRRESCTFEKLTVECYKRFPAVFRLPGYLNYPDSARVNKSWLRCRTDHGWIVGNLKTSFKLSAQGNVIARAVEKRLGVKTSSSGSRGGSRERTREEALVRFVRCNQAFKEFMFSRSSFHPHESDVYGLASCTLDTPPRVLKQNLLQLLQAARWASDKDAEHFVIACLEWSKKDRKRRLRT
jgi:hypothetical protein